ncbi:MAG: alpha/beta fold hydrolase [Gammaproteobacteria bacterium]
MSTQTVERMAVEVEGAGDPVILIHGLGGSSNVFTPQLPVFAGRYRIIRPDLPGSGRSPLGDALSIPLLAGRIVRMAEALGVERAHFVGHSLGTLVCQHLAVQHPKRVRSLALCGPLLAPTDMGREGLRQRARQARTEGMAVIAGAIVEGAISTDTRAQQPVVVALVRELVMRQNPEGYARTCEALAEAVAAEAALIQCPTLLMTGDEDAIAPPSLVRQLAERIDGARVRIFNRCGHWTTLERALEVNGVLKEFYSALHRGLSRGD